MKKVVLAALATIAVAAPTLASAQSFGFRIGPDRDYYGDRYYGNVPSALLQFCLPSCHAPAWLVRSLLLPSRVSSPVARAPSPELLLPSCVRFRAASALSRT